MGYEIRMVRTNEELEYWDEEGEQVRFPITREEWLAAVDQTPNVRRAEGEFTFRHPLTGEVYPIPTAEADAELFVAEHSEWIRAFCWSSDGYIRIAASTGFATSGDLVGEAARHLARLLGARLVGDSGEFYDLTLS
jgi:hypothetical protein